MNPTLRAVLLTRPRPIMDNMAAWYRKGRGITSASGAVSRWADASGNLGRDLVQATGSAQPALQDDGTILFNGTSHFLKAAAFTLNQPETIYILFKQVTWTLNDYVLDGELNNTARLGQEVGTPSLQLFAGSFAAANDGLAVDTYGAVAIVVNGASSLIQVGNATPTTGNAGANNMGGFTLGSVASGALGWSNIQVKEVIIYSVAHDSFERAKNIAYLSRL